MTKNIHILPTDKPSKLYISHKNKLWLTQDDLLYIKDEVWKTYPQNIYITSNDEFTSSKDWFIDIKDNRNQLHQVDYDLEANEWTEQYDSKWFKKVILTTDKDLIADGIQAIDDKFLEWFVKNPNCENVEVKPLLSNNGRAFFDYKIIIPKKEPKQETLEEIFHQIDDNKCRYSNEESEFWKHYKIGVLDGLKWQQERSYSEEKVLEVNNWYLETFLDDSLGLNGKDSKQKVKHLSGKGLTKEVLNYWFKQFKKK